MNPVRLLHVTRTPFWRRHSGSYARDLELLRWLSARAEVTCAVGQLPTPRDRALTANLGFPIRFQSIDPRAPVAAQADRLNRIVLAGAFDACIFDHLRTADLVHAIPDGVPTLLDTHDLVSLRNATDAAKAHKRVRDLSWDEELGIFRQFDKVVMIQADEQAKVARDLGADAVLVAPHPISLARRPVPPSVRAIGMLASLWHPNVEGAQWFVREAWPTIREHTDVELRFFGSVCNRLGDTTIADDPRIRLLGAVPHAKDAWAALDVSINPVQWGSGLKIKTVESLAAGIPLVTTTEGASGLSRLAGRGFLVADEPGPFAEHVLALVRSEALRDRITGTGHAWATEHLSPDACFGPLWHCLEQLVERRRR